MAKIKKFWNVIDEAETAEIMIYGKISDESWFEDEVTAKQFAKELKMIGGKNINVHINSLGGDVFAAQAIYTQLKNYSGEVNVYVDGICASAATIIACAGDKVRMPVNGIYMIHNPLTYIYEGCDAAQLEKITNALKAIKQTIINVYLEKTGDKINENKLSKLMDNEKYMTAEEAEKYGFIDEICRKSANIENKNGRIYINSLEIDKKHIRNICEFENIVNRKVANDMENEQTLFQKFKNWLKMENKVKNEDEEPEEDKNKESEGTEENGTADGKVKSAADKIKNAAIQAERKRVAELETMKTGNAIIDKFIDTAKANGEGVEKVKAYVETMKQATAPRNSGMDQLKDLVSDNLNSGASNLIPDGRTDKTSEEEKNEAIKALAGYMNQIRGVE